MIRGETDYSVITGRLHPERCPLFEEWLEGAPKFKLQLLVLGLFPGLPTAGLLSNSRCAEFVCFLSVSGASLALRQSVLIVRADGN
jgi:hypothetical protein